MERLQCRQKKMKSTKIPFFFLMPTLAVFYTMLILVLAIVGLILRLTYVFNPPLWTIILWLVPFMIYIPVILLLSVYLSIKHKNLLLIIIAPFIYTLEHASYGFGMLYSFFKK